MRSYAPYVPKASKVEVEALKRDDHAHNPEPPAPFTSAPQLKRNPLGGLA
jgi:hypothetical protein